MRAVARGVGGMRAPELHRGNGVDGMCIAGVGAHCEMLSQRMRGFRGGAGEDVHGIQA